MGCKASFCSRQLANAKIYKTAKTAKIGKKNNAEGRPDPLDHRPAMSCAAGF